jgi:hypothetical protein
VRSRCPWCRLSHRWRRNSSGCVQPAGRRSDKGNSARNAAPTRRHFLSTGMWRDYSSPARFVRRKALCSGSGSSPR